MSRWTTLKQNKPLLWSYVIAGIGVVIAIGSLWFAIQHNADQLAAQHQGTVTGCYRGKVLREDIRDEFVDLKKKVLIPVFTQFRDLTPKKYPSRQSSLTPFIECTEE